MKDYEITNSFYFSRILNAIGNEEELKGIATELSNKNDVKDVLVSEDRVIEDGEMKHRLIVKMSFASITDTLTVIVKAEQEPVVL